jgi:ribonuclease-3
VGLTDLCQANSEANRTKTSRPISSDHFAKSGRETHTDGHSIGASSLSKALNFPSIIQSPSNPSSRPYRNRKATDGSSTPQTYNGRLSTLPPLPIIRDASLAEVPFTHPGSLNSHPSKTVDVSYERLELLGDAYIELIATRLIFPRFPHHSAGRLSQLREMLVKNETLAEYGLAYGFDQRAKLPANFKDTVTAKVWTKTIGDIFEAYVAAVIVDDPEQGVQTTDTWLCALWENKLSKQPAREMQTADSDTKALLGKILLGRGIKLEYKDQEPPQAIRKEGKLIYHMGVDLTGWGWDKKCLGEGKGLSMKEAGAMAAKEALANPLTAQVASVKREFDERVRAERRNYEQDPEDFKKEEVEEKQIKQV